MKNPPRLWGGVSNQKCRRKKHYFQREPVEERLFYIVRQAYQFDNIYFKHVCIDSYEYIIFYIKLPIQLLYFTTPILTQ